MDRKLDNQEPNQEAVTLPRKNEKPTDDLLNESEDLLSRLIEVIEDFTKRLA